MGIWRSHIEGIIIASFGSIYQDVSGEIHRQYRDKMRSMYSDVEVRRVFLSDALVKVE